LWSDWHAPRKQRHTAQRIFEVLRDEFGYAGGSSQVRAAVKALKARAVEAFIPLVSIPGEAEADFFEAMVDLAGVRVKVHAFLMVLPLSGAWFMRVYRAENSETFLDGNASAFGFFGGTPRRIVYDNPAYAVNHQGRPLTGRDRVLCRDAIGMPVRGCFRGSAQRERKRIGGEEGRVLALVLVRAGSSGIEPGRTE
ncbi:MAG: hypothetical protein ACREJ3_16950, partial [Polyangiaceae bacterium]